VITAVDDHQSAERLAALVSSYSRRVNPAVLEQHAGASVSSPLGVWLLLAACVSGAGGADRTALEEVLGCAGEEASELLAMFMRSAPPALKAAIAVWTRAADQTEDLAGWVRSLPSEVEAGSMPSQREADQWADTRTLGLIKTFPLAIDDDTRIVLASALATKVSWKTPFGVVPAEEHLGTGSPWRGTVARLLWDKRPHLALIARSPAAGLVAVHQARATEDLTVISVSASPDVPRTAVLEAAHEVAASARQGLSADACSLFDLPIGEGHSWQITEQEVATHEAGQQIERIPGASLPAWHIESKLDLLRSESFGAGPALAAIREMIGRRPDDETSAVQAAVASFTREGFEAAAVTGFAVRASARRRDPQERGTERQAILRFDHPYAAVAIAGRPSSPNLTAATRSQSAYTGLPLFSAWIHEPQEAKAGIAGRPEHLG
jgi:Serpin (serine protease inhibitor)